AESVPLFSVRTACSAIPGRQGRRPSPYSPATSADPSRAAPIGGFADPSAARRTTPDSAHRAKRRSRAFRPRRADRTLLHHGIRNFREVAPPESPPGPSFLTSFQNEGSPWGTP